MQWSAATAVCRNRTVDKNRDRTRMQWYCGTGVCIHSFVVCIVYVNEWRDVMTSIATLCGYFALDSSFTSCVIVLSVMHCTVPACPSILPLVPSSVSSCPLLSHLRTLFLTFLLRAGALSTSCARHTRVALPPPTPR